MSYDAGDPVSPTLDREVFPLGLGAEQITTRKKKAGK